MAHFQVLINRGPLYYFLSFPSSRLGTPFLEAPLRTPFFILMSEPRRASRRAGTGRAGVPSSRSSPHLVFDPGRRTQDALSDAGRRSAVAEHRTQDALSDAGRRSAARLSSPKSVAELKTRWKPSGTNRDFAATWRSSSAHSQSTFDVIRLRSALSPASSTTDAPKRSCRSAPVRLLRSLLRFQSCGNC